MLANWYPDLDANYFHGTPERCCSIFGCGNKLTPHELLFGDKCSIHSNSTRMSLIKTKVNEIRTAPDPLL